MEYQKIINLLDTAPNQPSKFKTKNWVDIGDESHGVYNIGSQIKFKTSMLRSGLCDYSEVYILVKGTITVPNTGTAATPNNKNKKVIFKNCAPFTDCVSEINNKGIDYAKDIDEVMPMYNLIEYSDTDSKISGSLRQYYRDDPFMKNNCFIVDVPNNPGSALFKSKQKLTGQTGNGGTKDVQIMIPLKYLSNFRELLKCY